MSLFGSFGDEASGMRHRPGLVSLLYRSRATTDFDDAHIDALVSRARLRNHERDVTGALYFDEGQFMQWLEGPASTIIRLFGHIGRDRRHTDLEVLSFGQTPQRVFGDWNMRLFHDFSELPLVNALDPGVPALGIVDNPDELRHMALALAKGRVGEFAIALKQTGSDFPAQAMLCERLMQRYAELWAVDDCSEMDTVLGLALAQTQFRLHRARFPGHALPCAGETVLVMPVPGERHALSASLAQAALEESGFTVPAGLPESMSEASKLLSACFCNHAVVASSGVFEHQHRIPVVRRCAQDLRCLLPRSATVLLYGQLAARGATLVSRSGCNRGTPRAVQIPSLIDLHRGQVH